MTKKSTKVETPPEPTPGPVCKCHGVPPEKCPGGFPGPAQHIIVRAFKCTNQNGGTYWRIIDEDKMTSTIKGSWFDWDYTSAPLADLVTKNAKDEGLDLGIMRWVPWDDRQPKKAQRADNLVTPEHVVMLNETFPQSDKDHLRDMIRQIAAHLKTIIVLLEQI